MKLIRKLTDSLAVYIFTALLVSASPTSCACKAHSNENCHFTCAFDFNYKDIVSKMKLKLMTHFASSPSRGTWHPQHRQQRSSQQRRPGRASTGMSLLHAKGSPRSEAPKQCCGPECIYLINYRSYAHDFTCVATALLLSNCCESLVGKMHAHEKLHEKMHNINPPKIKQTSVTYHH